MHKARTILLAALALLLALAGAGDAEIYRYRDQEGRLFFVDGLDKVPEEYRREAQTREELPNLPRPEPPPSAQKESAPAEEAPGPETQTFPETRVIISNNQVLVPAQVCFRGNRVQVLLLLDTGAQALVLDTSVGDRLRIVNPPRVAIQGVGGAVMPAGLVTLDYIKVGPHLKKGIQALILPGPSSLPYRGLLGMTFLSGIRYHIDYQKRVIRWMN
ncbi:MAG: retropepsin-like aspartic protease [Thermodesulfobacteriota bacterium]